MKFFYTFTTKCAIQILTSGHVTGCFQFNDNLCFFSVMSARIHAQYLCKIGNVFLAQSEAASTVFIKNAAHLSRSRRGPDERCFRGKPAG